ncbi:MurNAc alpha-1-phosphate uridylyltransferase [Rhodovulum imhoffii]|uniref:MurNAc alpha-1-phosphate uridylyltransferase n=1 Tax=Rhodovulum imhoffii TaxID=365340 RepID=A0A2T5BRM0_9RHOB|nr:nucleotidyltransferase family protein [Rhodovulum imhoffii]MBK5934050.1 nucleotidyltransferase [Rhodovulum imhoffii]PTN01935.1 MurNAc alpha-1-phosphate uridylyltransferase [Rhodovulum imhoffii]
MPDAVMLFAAGFGTRMAPLTADRPKPLIPVGGKPLLDHALGIAQSAGVGRIVVNTHYLGEQIATHLAESAVTLSPETPDILDTGGGLRHALPLLGAGPVFTLNTDAVWTGENPLTRLARAWDPARMDALLLLIPREAALGHAGMGDFMPNPDGRLKRGPGAVYSGAQILKTGGLTEIPEQVFSLNRLWNRMLERGRLFGVLHRGGWCDVGTPEGIPRAEAMLEADDV